MSLEVNITKKLDGFTLHANFAARSTATAILGASGCGKSMTLRCIAGIVKPDAGRIVLDGRVLFDSAQHIDLPPQQRGVGLLFQNYALFPNMTVEQNVLCGLKAEKDKAARKARCAEMLQAMRLESLAKRYPAQLSGGGGALRVCKHLFGAAGAQHLPAIHHDHIPAQAVGFVSVVGDQQRRSAKPGQQAAHFALHFLAQVAVQRTERLVQHQNFGPAHKDACQRGALLLSAGKLGRIISGFCF